LLYAAIYLINRMMQAYIKGRTMRIGRRDFIGAAAALGVAQTAPASAAGAGFTPDWSSLAAGYRVPAWFGEARFGIWGHWGPQCVGAKGDWYGRLMYVPGTPFYQHHLKTYGHPADHGFMEMINLWRGEHWDPDYLVGRYKAAGAKYIMALACHHDNFDLFQSQHHPWNATAVGPRRDIVGGWEKAVRKAGLRFGLSNHTSHAWHWWQTAYGYDAQGPRKGQRYDAWGLRAEQGKGQWWDGLDPQTLYTGPNMAPPDGLPTDAAMAAWHDAHDGDWMEFAPAVNPAFVQSWLVRQMDLVERYRPDMIYLDNYGLPFGSTGLKALAHYYNQAAQWHGTPDVVLTAKKLSAADRKIMVDDVERGYADAIRPEPWQTCTCLGDWFYNEDRLLQKSYMPAEKVIQRLIDTVSKNGNLLLSVPMRGDGMIDSDEEKILDGLTAWMGLHGDAMINGSRPWRVFGEGPTRVGAGMQGEDRAGVFTAQDLRYTVKDGALYAAFMAWPQAPVTLTTLGLAQGQVEQATLLGGGPVPFRQDGSGLTLTLPPRPTGGIVPVVRLRGRGLI
jgi:alpha-L-fucosidase